MFHIQDVVDRTIQKSLYKYMSQDCPKYEAQDLFLEAVDRRIFGHMSRLNLDLNGGFSSIHRMNNSHASNCGTFWGERQTGSEIRTEKC